VSRPQEPGRPLPDPLPVPVVDNHTHLDHMGERDGGVFRPPPDEQVAELISVAAEAGVPRMVQIGCDLESARWTAEVVRHHPALLGGVALHPTEAAEIALGQGFSALEEALLEIGQLAAEPRIRVIGETGLDHYWIKDAPGRAAQEESFRRHIRLARELDMVLQIHDRDAHDDILRVLAEEGAPEKTVFHCFSGDAAMARYCVDQGWYLSFSGVVTFKNAESTRDALRAVPLDHVLIETDAPYLTPVPYRGRPNGSHLMPFTVRGIADTLGLPIEEICVTIDRTTKILYGPW
jgi:TatD DNase family protein